MSNSNGTALGTRANSTDGVGESPDIDVFGEQLHGRRLLRAADPVAEVRARVAQQQELVALKREELTDEELKAEAELAQEERKQRREQRMRALTAMIKAEDAEAERERQAAQKAAEQEAKRQEQRASLLDWRATAAATAERLTSTDLRLARLARQLTWTSRALVALVVLGMVWSAVNVQRNLVPDQDVTKPLFWVSYFVEALISGALVIIMLTSQTLGRWGRADDRTGGHLLEFGLVCVSLLLNTLAPLVAGDIPMASECAVAPMAVGMLLWVHGWSTGRLSDILATENGEAELMEYVEQGFAAMKRGDLVPSTAADGGGVPAAGQLQKYFELSKPKAIAVRNQMKRHNNVGDQR